MVGQSLKRQHQDIRRVLQELQEDVYDEQEVLQNQLSIALRIGNLSGILLMHLKYEDEYLYPQLLQHPDHKVREISKSSIQEMGDLSQAFEEYQKKYLKTPDNINDTDSFIKDTNQILYLISKRVEKEEHEIFPLIDKNI